MNMTRRDFGMALAVAIPTGFILEGCNAASVFAQIEQWVPVGKQAFAGIVSLLGPFLPPGAQAVIVIVNASFDTLLAAAKEYLASPAASQPAIITKIQAALQAIADNIQIFLNDLNLAGNPLISTVLGLAQLVLATIAGFLNQIPTPAGAKMQLARATVRVGQVSAPIIPKARSVESFKKAYNQIADANGHSGIDL